MPKNIDTIHILGAEKQCTTSIALAYPELQFIGHVDHPEVDGWDIPNLTFVQDGAATTEVVSSDSRFVYACQRWAYSTKGVKRDAGVFTLSEALKLLSNSGVLTPAHISDPDKKGRLKGDKWRKPDAVEETSLNNVGRNYACGFSVQETLQPDKTFSLCGRTNKGQESSFGVVEVLRERYGREAFALAAETVNGAPFRNIVRAVEDSLEFEGLFSLNILLVNGDFYVSSFRRTIPPYVGLLRKSGFDMFGVSSIPDREDRRYGYKAVFEHHYSTYGALK